MSKFVEFSDNPNKYEKMNGEFRVYECDDRGAIFHLGPNPKDAKRSLKLRFDQTNNGDQPILGQIRIHTASGEPIEAGYESVRLLERSDAFNKGRVRYILSPEERRANSKAESQAKQLAIYKDQLTEGVFVLNANMSVDATVKLADLIGAVYVDENGVQLAKASIFKNIQTLLGDIKPVVEVPQEVEAPQEVPKVKAAPGRGRGRRAAVSRK